MKNIAIVMGGFSSEAQISIKSGEFVYNNLDKSKYRLYCVHILKDSWKYVDYNNPQIAIDINRHDFSVVLPSGEKVCFDAVFNTVHGTPGEDGLLQAYFKLLNISQTSCDTYQAALTFNKRDCISVLQRYGVPTAKNYFISKGDVVNHDKVVETVGLPCFVKANQSGSSFGITKVYKKSELDNALEVAFKEGDDVIIESFLEGTEVSVGVITYDGEVMVLPCTEIVSENDFFDYEAKYQGKSQEITPARISDQEREAVQEMAVQIYKFLKIKGYSRSEFIFHQGKPHFLEVNTNPGLTQVSILPQQAQAAGISLQDLFGSVIESCLSD